MGKFMDRFKKVLQYVDTGVDFAKEALPEDKAEDLTQNTEEGAQLKSDIYNGVIFGEEKLLDLHDMKNVPPEVEKHIDAALVSLTKAGLIWAGQIKHKTAVAYQNTSGADAVASEPKPDGEQPA